MVLAWDPELLSPPPHISAAAAEAGQVSGGELAGWPEKTRHPAGREHTSRPAAPHLHPALSLTHCLSITSSIADTYQFVHQRLCVRVCVSICTRVFASMFLLWCVCV